MFLKKKIKYLVQVKMIQDKVLKLQNRKPTLQNYLKVNLKLMKVILIYQSMKSYMSLMIKLWTIILNCKIQIIKIFKKFLKNIILFIFLKRYYE